MHHSIYWGAIFLTAISFIKVYSIVKIELLKNHRYYTGASQKAKEAISNFKLDPCASVKER
jgi:hypothetical protein